MRVCVCVHARKLPSNCDNITTQKQFEMKKKLKLMNGFPTPCFVVQTTRSNGTNLYRQRHCRCFDIEFKSLPFCFKTMFGLDAQFHIKFVFDYNSMKIFVTKIKNPPNYYRLN